jgi:hypothetical protein
LPGEDVVAVPLFVPPVDDLDVVELDVDPGFSVI